MSHLGLDCAGCRREGIAAATGDYREGDKMNEERHFPYMTYDSEIDAAYVYFRKVPWDHKDILDDYRNVDYGPDGEPNGVELLYVSDGVNLDGLPRRDVIERLLAERHIPMFA
jgi:uncharacterized protein YuzE